MKKSTVVVMAIALLSWRVSADPVKFAPNFSADSVSMATSVGGLSASAKELVYDTGTGRKVSQLNWKMKNATILKGDISWDTYPFLTLNAQGWTTLTSGAGAHMDDYDWLNSTQAHWTEHSSHPDTNINYANEYDLNMKGWILQNENYKAGIMAGYQETRFSWIAKGGSYSYHNGTIVGHFPDGVKGIGYGQRFAMPYIGLVGRYRINAFNITAQFKYSNWVNAHDNDEHYMRDLTFREKTSGSRYYGVSVDTGYDITRNTEIFAEFAYNKYEEAKGGTQIIDKVSGAALSIGGDAAGISNSNYAVTVGLKYRF
ncbi:omptin family outer membrane protease [Salmonella enterica subsp. enterica serovar Lomalinda]|nr:omptin family outer membrane protease [Salmonella enterica subsp. enterica serovar Lomalinda]ECI5321609.1 omptin family outer membrane protease [Salmonella enterica subsp. enterica serovar Lomalinda]